MSSQNRRFFSGLFATTFLAVVILNSASAETNAPEFRLKLFNEHTHERLNIVYRRGFQVMPAALERLDYFLRDHRNGTVRHYDPRVFELLHDLLARLGRSDSELDVVCGYRTPQTNEYLRTHGHGVALHSLHMQAMAIDIRIPGVDTAAVRDAALALHEGGVGYYPSSQFVHVDVGRVRRW